MQFSKRFFSINLLIFFNLMLFQGLFGQNRVSSNNNPSSPCSICGTDERVPSYNNAIGRIVRGNSVVGTAWATKNNKFVTAGHCFKNGTDNLTLEFNVPFSNTHKSIVQQLRNSFLALAI